MGFGLLVNVPIVAISLVLIPRLVPTSRDRDAHARPGRRGLSTAGLTALLYGIIEGPQHGWTSTQVLGGLLVGLAILAGFVWWESQPTTHAP